MKTILKFGADWCGPCKRVEGVFMEVNQMFPNVEFQHVNIDVDDELANEYGVQSIPTFILLKNGKIVGRLTSSDKKEVHEFLVNFCK